MFRMNQPLKSLLARGRADQVVHKTNPKNKLICPRIFFLQYLNSPKWRRTNPASRKIESFLGGTARPRSYREATPIACDVFFTLELRLGRSIFKCCWDIDIQLSSFRQRNEKLYLHIYKESFDLNFYKHFFNFLKKFFRQNF